MLDQSFTAKNFERIFLRDNRKGIFHKEFFPEQYFEIHSKFKFTLKEKLELKKIRDLTPEEISEFAEKLNSLNLEKENIRRNLFKEAANEILKKNFSFGIKYDKSKKTFQANTKKCSIYYSIKKLQFNINRTFKVKQSNRNEIIDQIFNTLSDGFPKVILKTDIKKFYESISQDRLLNKLESTTILSPFSIELIKKLLYEFNTVKDKRKIKPKKGIPRGIGASAYLSELYMRDFDNAIRKLPDLIYYSRYVDDMFLVFVPRTPSLKRNYLSEIKEIAKKEDLQLNTQRNKTIYKSLLHNQVQDINLKFPYLGYEFDLDLKNGMTKLKIEISPDKKKKYESRIQKSIIAYNEDAKKNEKNARKLLFQRLKYLTGNFHLNGSKKGLKSGIYYSNIQLILNQKKDQIKSLKHLDNKLKGILNQHLIPPSGCITKQNLKNYIVNRFSFESGFNNRRKNFYSFKSTDAEIEESQNKHGFKISRIDKITSAWNDE